MCKHIIWRYRPCRSIDDIKGAKTTKDAGDGVKDGGGVGNAELKV